VDTCPSWFTPNDLATRKNTSVDKRLLSRNIQEKNKKNKMAEQILNIIRDSLKTRDTEFLEFPDLNPDVASQVLASLQKHEDNHGRLGLR